jgi:hypothetical protein
MITAPMAMTVTPRKCDEPQCIPLDAGRIIFFQKNPKNIVVFQNILLNFLRKNCKKNKTYFIVQIIVMEYYIFIGEI